MGLYLCVFRGDEELLGFDCGGYDDFEAFRDAARALDRRRLFRRYHTLRMNVSPTTMWSPREVARLARELERLDAALRALPPRPFAPGSWQARLAEARGLAPASLRESFVDVDGVPLVDRLRELCAAALEARQPILFQ
jgi:hypothetical protein